MKETPRVRRVRMYFDRADQLREQAVRCEQLAVQQALAPDRVKFELIVYKDTFTRATQSEIEAALAERIGDNATVVLVGHEEL